MVRGGFYWDKNIFVPVEVYNTVATVQPTPWPTSSASAGAWIEIPAEGMRVAVGSADGKECWSGPEGSDCGIINPSAVTNFQGEGGIDQLEVFRDLQRDTYGIWELGFQEGSPWASPEFEWQELGEDLKPVDGRRIIVAALEPYPSQYVGRFYNRLVVQPGPTPTPPSGPVTPTDNPGPGDIYDRPVEGNLVVGDRWYPLVETEIVDGVLRAVNQALGFYKNQRGGLVVNWHATQFAIPFEENAKVLVLWRGQRWGFTVGDLGTVPAGQEGTVIMEGGPGSLTMITCTGKGWTERQVVAAEQVAN